MKLETYRQAFRTSFGIADDMLNDALTYQSIPMWDSVGHMQLMAALEDEFGILMDTEDILEFSSYEKGKTILAKYGVVL